jgi:hypothetical protein
MTRIQGNQPRNPVTSLKQATFSIVDLTSPEEESLGALRLWISGYEQSLASKTSSHMVERRVLLQGDAAACSQGGHRVLRPLDHSLAIQGSQVSAGE